MTGLLSAPAPAEEGCVMAAGCINNEEGGKAKEEEGLSREEALSGELGILGV